MIKLFDSFLFLQQKQCFRIKEKSSTEMAVSVELFALFIFKEAFTLAAYFVLMKKPPLFPSNIRECLAYPFLNVFQI